MSHSIRLRALTGVALLSLSIPGAYAQDGLSKIPDSGAQEAAAQAPAADDAAARAAREASFAALLTGSVLEGFTTVSNAEGLQPDSYTLKSVSKQPDGRWKFEAVIHYGKRPIPVAINLPVEWAGDTPVISVTGLAVPFMGTYDARVLFHGDQYVGVWTGKGYGGHIFGKVVRDTAAPAAGDQPSAKDDADSGKQASVPSWPQFRGEGARGVSDGHVLPASFDVETGENVLWRVPVSGLAHSSPVIHGDRIYLTTAVRVAGDQELRVGLYGDIGSVQDSSEFRFELHCFERSTGKHLWERVAWQGVPAIKRHPKGSHAASTPATDGEHVVAFFGTEGLYCFDRDGKQLWKRDFGVLDSGFFRDVTAQWGFASSPVIHDGRVIVQCDVQGPSFLAALDIETGKELWRSAREEEPGWSTPTVHVDGERAHVLCNGWKHMGAYTLADGAPVWRVVPGGDIPVPTPIVSHGLVYLTNAHGGPSPILAIDLDATGLVSFREEERAHMKWGLTKGGNYMQTPIVYGDYAYFCRDNGVLTCFGAADGTEQYSTRLSDGATGFTSSPVAGDGKLFYTGEDGVVVTVVAGPTFEVLARSPLGEEHMASPAIVDGVLYFRSRGHLTAIGQRN